MTAAPDWYRTFFDADYLRVFGPELDEERTTAEVDGVVALTGCGPGTRLLDLACGQGRHAVALARRGCRVEGLDLSPTLLAAAARAAERAGVTVTWHRQDMREPVMGGARFDVVLSLFNAFGYLESDAEDLRVLTAAASVLVEDGVLLQEVGNREAYLRGFRPDEVHRLPDGLVVLEERTLDLAASRVEITSTLLEPDGAVSGRRRHRLRLYTLTELIAAHEAAGLHVESVLGSLEGDELDLDAPFVVLRSRAGPGAHRTGRGRGLAG